MIDDTPPEETINLDSPKSSTNQPTAPKPAKKKRRSPKQWFLDLSKKQKIIFIVAVVLIIAGIGTGGYLWYRHSHQPKAVAIVKLKSKVAAPTTVASPLSGVQVAPALAKRAVTGFMIENSQDARPQSGLNQAGIVFEAVAEGGITRFLALFQDTQPDYIGPIRSARPYYLDWLLPFDAAYAHVGGSPAAITAIQNLGVKDLNQFYNGNSYIRVSSRAAPHNVYTSMTAIDQLEQQKGYTSSSFTSLPRKKEAPAAKPNAISIDFSVSSALYNPHYDYVAKDNAYLRSEGGAPHTDEKSGAQLEPKVVIALVTPSVLDPDGDHTDYNTTAGGPMYVFQDGAVAQGTWNKAGSKNQFVFKTTSGADFKLNPGQTWITMVGAASDVTYK